MPSVQPVPTLADLRKAYRDAVVGQRDNRSDLNDGSGYDLTSGPAAILWSRQGQRDRDMFHAVYFDTAQGDDLTNRGNSLYQIPRILDTYGTGVATLVRATASGGSGTVPTGTRFFIVPSNGQADARVYKVSADTVASATQTLLQVPVSATVLGVGTALAATSGGGYIMQIQDPLWDTSWTLQSIQTVDGTTFEKAEDYRARVRVTRAANRVGYKAAIINTLAGIGATNVALFASSWAGLSQDYGLNWCYVADASFNGSPALITACDLALESVRVLGCDLQVLPISTVQLTVSLQVSLWDDPGNFDLGSITTSIQANVAAYFDGRRNAYSYQLDAIFGAVARASTAIQNLTILSPASSANVTTTVNGIAEFPAVLNRYVISQQNIAVSYVGPQ